ncbi:hypothetical protein C0991_003268, partial [Blastosporella zonata]
MTLVEPQPVQLLQIGNSQICAFHSVFFRPVFTQSKPTLRPTAQFLSFNTFLDALDGSYCTSQGGDDLTYDPVLPDPIP